MRSKKYDLDDIGHIGGGPPPTEEDFRAISAFIKARKVKKVSKSATTKRAAKARVVKKRVVKKA